MTPYAIVMDEVVWGSGGSQDVEISLRVAKGDYLAIIGPSRSGKSVVVELCAGVMSPRSGRIFVLGFEWADLSSADHEIRLHIGTVLQQPGLLSNMTVYNNVSLPLRYHRAMTGEKERHERVMAHLEALHLTHVRDQFPARLTPGEARCAAIARAMTLDPDLLLLDDAVSGLDADMVARVSSHLSHYRKTNGITVLATLRGPSALLTQVDRIAVLRDGRLEAVGDRETILAGASRGLNAYLAGC